MQRQQAAQQRRPQQTVACTFIWFPVDQHLTAPDPCLAPFALAAHVCDERRFGIRQRRLDALEPVVDCQCRARTSRTSSGPNGGAR